MESVVPQLGSHARRGLFAGTFLVSLLVGVVCGLTGALQASKTGWTSALKDEAGLRGSGLARLSWRNALVAVQVAGALVLIAASGLFLRSGRQALRFDPGFDARHLAFTRIELPRQPDPALTRVQGFRDLQARVAALPEVQAVSMSDGALLEGTGYRDGHKLQVPGDERMPFGQRVIGSVIVGTDYLKTIGLPLASGRDFIERDRVVSSHVVIVNEALAQRAFPGESAVGRHVRLLPRLSRGKVEQVITSAFFGLFGALGLLLAAVGLSGVLSYAVARRTREIGVRMALGADGDAVLKTVISEGVVLTLAGVVAGLFLASALTRGLAGFLFGISAADPLTYVAASMLLMLVAPVGYIPARRAASVDPLIALRHD